MGRGGVDWLTTTHVGQNACPIVELAAKNRLPAIYPNSEYVDAGGLMSYAADIVAMFHRSAAYADRILKGAKPGELPVEQPTKFELVINLKAVKQIGSQYRRTCWRGRIE